MINEEIAKAITNFIHSDMRVDDYMTMLAIIMQIRQNNGVTVTELRQSIQKGLSS